MTILIKAGTGVLAGVIAAALGLVFLPRMQPAGVTPRAAVGHPQFVASVSPESPQAARSATTLAVPLAASPVKPAPEAKAAAAPSPQANPPETPAVLTRLEPPKPAPAPVPPAPVTKAAAPPQPPAPVAAIAETRTAAADAAPRSQPSSASPGNADSARWSVQGLVALAKGDLSSARLYLTRAANAGDPRAWVALADTYDPAILAKLGVVGAPGDARRAKDFLQKAADAGLVVAKGRMAALDQDASSVR